MMKTMKNMTNRISMLVILLAISTTTISLDAQTYSTKVGDNNPFHGRQMVGGGVYDGTVYEPFTNELPSESVDPTNDGKSRNNKPGIRNSKEDGSEYGQSTEYPIGDGVWAMVFCALAFAGVIALRRKRAASKD